MNAIAMSVLLFCALSMFIGTMADRWWLLRAGDARRPAATTSGSACAPCWCSGFGQKRLLQERGAGWMHVAIFAGFLVVFTRTCTLIGRGFDADFHLPLLGGGLGLVYAAFEGHLRGHRAGGHRLRHLAPAGDASRAAASERRRAC